MFRYMPGSPVFDRELAQRMIDAGKVSVAMRDRELYSVSGQTQCPLNPV